MVGTKVLILIVLFSLSLLPRAKAQGPSLRDFYELEDPHIRRVAQSVAVGVEKTHVIPLNNGGIRIRRADLPREKMCLLEEFHNQGRIPTSGTGFLVAPNLLLTAGHNVKDPGDCASIVWVFDYALQNPGGMRWGFVVGRSSVYECAEIVSLEYSPCGGPDVALIRLNRDARGRTPLATRTSGKISDDARLYLFGYPRGFPLKVATVENIFNGDPEVFFTSFGHAGLSGGPAVDTATGLVEGVVSCMITNGGSLAFGPRRSLYDEENDCYYYERNARDPMAGTGIIARLEVVSGKLKEITP